MKPLLRLCQRLLEGRHRLYRLQTEGNVIVKLKTLTACSNRLNAMPNVMAIEIDLVIRHREECLIFQTCLGSTSETIQTSSENEPDKKGSLISNLKRLLKPTVVRAAILYLKNRSALNNKCFRWNSKSSMKT